MKLHVRHTTRYRYTEPLRYALQTLWLTPRSGPSQTIAFWSLGAPGELHAQRDGCGNSIHSYTFVGEVADQVTGSLVNAAGQVDTLGVAQFSDDEMMPHPAFFLRPTQLAAPHAQLAEFGRRFVTGDAADLPALLALSQAVADTVRYKKDSTSVETTALQAFNAGAGVCQDQAHVMVAICRSLGIPARYVSGYFYAANEPDLASHAWADVCLDVARRRWGSIDVTHSCLIDQRHVRLAVGTDYNACPPIKGVRQGGGKESMTVDITITPV
ncbi:MAG: transglutaminase family protein [Polaromonas sp.]|uniref:transglutaminase family protein n=1 Tax=Polaromonas sp. TaxID=1869339 RepID=UPI0027374511|nr:transglutaminase family protein [Polaromonas sp.]MDP2816705.1 transglutaminase family protein [Polaromonas sp.]